MEPTRSARRRHAASPFSDPIPPEAKQFGLGDRVSHDSFGLGSIVGVEDGVAVLVDFKPRRERITAPYAKLFKL